MATSSETPLPDDWGFGQIQISKKKKMKKGGRIHTLPVPPPPPAEQDAWQPEAFVEKASYNDGMTCEPEITTEYGLSAKDLEPYATCDIPAPEAKEGPMSEKLGENEAATIPTTNTAEEEEELAALTVKKAKRGKLLKRDMVRLTLLTQRAQNAAQAQAAKGDEDAAVEAIPEKADWGYTWDYVALAKPPADETPKEDKPWPEEETAAVEAEPIEDAKPMDEEEHKEPKPDDCIQKDHEIAKLPFSSPYKLAAYLQQILEQACFAYGQKNWPELLRKNNWDCVEAVSLTTWVKKLEGTLDMQPSRCLLQSIAEVQAIAVERRPIDWPMMKKFFDDAIELTKILNVKEYGEIILQVQLDIGKIMKSLSQDEEVTRSQEEKKLHWIAEERRKLDEREAEVRKGSEKSTNEFQKSAEWEVKRVLKEAEKHY
ncbi:uncharacterized protein FMAN_14243 [Fusarium mangiferae]|uniref:Uncharacterized protein n=1 Tax=Fusarium mangiferae TaxID=192010 RepID=A0A1L7UEN8_FUSMA|nr:uncharacterized protein FMAN_14243 [Fusarium mangiferae]CVL09124.1 uncharacterized protein FMAN_14243 [Fusarium mangiferae]